MQLTPNIYPRTVHLYYIEKLDITIGNNHNKTDIKLQKRYHGLFPLLKKNFTVIFHIYKPLCDTWPKQVLKRLQRLVYFDLSDCLTQQLKRPFFVD